MSNESKQPTQKVDIEKSAKTEESKAKVFAKSDWPNSPKEFIKLVGSIVLSGCLFDAITFYRVSKHHRI